MQIKVGTTFLTEKLFGLVVGFMDIECSANVLSQETIKAVHKTQDMIKNILIELTE